MSTRKILAAIVAFVVVALLLGMLFHAIGWNAHALAIFMIAGGAVAAWFVLKKSGIQ